jgi:hypothetical protein
MREALLAQPRNTAWMVVTGPCTNAGLLFVTFPEVVAHITGLSIMGGAIGGGFQRLFCRSCSIREISSTQRANKQSVDGVEIQVRNTILNLN